jgi:GntR family transcriptional regulator
MNFFDDKPVRFDVISLRADLCAGMLMEDFEKTSVQEILMTRFGLPITKIEQTMVAIGLPDKIAGLFDVDSGYPVFHFKRTAFTHSKALSYTEYYMRGEMAFKDTFSPQVDLSDFKNGV